VIVLKQAPDVMRAHLQARCERYGKPFNAEYWDSAKLLYEGSRRYPALVRKYAPPGAAISEVDVSLDFSSLEPWAVAIQEMQTA
jgi:hypothetical protein